MRRCLMRHIGTAALLAQAACSFLGAESDPTPPCEFALSALCDVPLRSTREFSGAVEIDTSMDSRCDAIIAADSTAGTPAICAITGEDITIEPDATVRGVGARALAFVAARDLVINGVIDVSSTAKTATADAVLGAGANQSACPTFARAPSATAVGGAGGAGASLAGRGGDGGDANTSAGANANRGGQAGAAITGAQLLSLRAGCRGQDGASAGAAPTSGPGGAGGGAVYLAARRDVNLFGGVNAGGAGGGGGGLGGGGGGGGSGGMIVVDATKFAFVGVLAANGGGGGEGGDLSVAGGAGANGQLDVTAAAGGFQSSSLADGGAGAAKMPASAGAPTLNSGGGGGGGEGELRLARGTVTGNTGRASPGNL
jgi:hypothetical protein